MIYRVKRPTKINKAEIGFFVLLCVRPSAYDADCCRGYTETLPQGSLSPMRSLLLFYACFASNLRNKWNVFG